MAERHTRREIEDAAPANILHRLEKPITIKDTNGRETVIEILILSFQGLDKDLNHAYLLRNEDLRGKIAITIKEL